MSAIDQNVIAERKEEMEDMYPDLVSTFVDDAVSTLAAIKKAVHYDSAEDLRQSAHALKSSSGYMGASRVVELAGRLEKAGLAGNAASEAVTADELQVAVDEAISELSLSKAA